MFMQGHLGSKWQSYLTLTLCSLHSSLEACSNQRVMTLKKKIILRKFTLKILNPSGKYRVG